MKLIRFLAQVLAVVFQPAFYPMVGFIILFTLTYLSMLPWQFKLWVLLSVYVFSIAIPYSMTFIIRKSNGWSKHDLHLQHRRYIVYSINIISYLSCMYVCYRLYLPSFMGAILVVSLLVQCVCVITNMWYKVSMHSAGTGVIIGALLAYSHIFAFNPLWWLCIAILLSGAVMSSRMLLKGNTLGQVLSGTAIGIVCGVVGIMMW
jgi:membrane-associated phospholipid phosphatase